MSEPTSTGPGESDWQSAIATWILPTIPHGVLTTESREQAAERTGGKHGNRGHALAETAIRMANLMKALA